MLGKLFEWWAARSNPRFYAFREAKQRYMGFLHANGVSFESMSEDLQRRARDDAGLKEAAMHFREAIRLSREAGPGCIRDVAVGEYQLGMLLHLQGAGSEAAGHLRAALGVIEDLPQQDGTEQSVASGCYYHLGLIALRSGDTAAARTMIGKSMKIDQSLNDASGVRMCQSALEKCNKAEGLA